MTKLVLVGCGAAKQDTDRPVPAKDLYTSSYFGLKRRYAEVVGDHWAVLSAEHGLLPPTKEILPYETSIDDLDGDALDELAHDVGMDLIDWSALTEADEIVVLAGRKYIEPLRERETFHAGVGANVTFPLQQAALGGIGEQMAWLKTRASDQRQTKLTEMKA